MSKKQIAIIFELLKRDCVPRLVAKSGSYARLSKVRLIIGMFGGERNWSFDCKIYIGLESM